MHLSEQNLRPFFGASKARLHTIQFPPVEFRLSGNPLGVKGLPVTSLGLYAYLNGVILGGLDLSNLDGRVLNLLSNSIRYA